MLACWAENPNGDYFKKHLVRIPDYIWIAEDGIKLQVKRQLQLLILQTTIARKIR